MKMLTENFKNPFGAAESHPVEKYSFAGMGEIT
jgi:hypothetical protein